MKSILTAALAACLLFTGVSALTGCNGARSDALNSVSDGPTGFMIKTLHRGDRERKYGLFVPVAYSPTQAYPVIIFLHGMGEGGSDARANMRVGLAPFVHDRQSDFPFICIFPQSSSGGWDENSEAAADAIAELDAVSAAYHVDQDRVSLTGLSTGGYGTWAIGAKYKDRFAALVPMGSSSYDGKDAQNLVDMPIWAFHNDGDMFAGVWNDTSMVDKVNSLGGHAKINTYGALGHDVWETVYAKGELFDWLLQQRKSARTAGSVPSNKTSSVIPAHSTGNTSSASAGTHTINTPY
ncbi:MAG TPA: prolyl oligopeptidase family serine peptidase [Phycisphaerae bacterium]|nr:prolyl oligopeptidase family serine peptidase [Phycisphaerae bacterium]